MIKSKRMKEKKNIIIFGLIIIIVVLAILYLTDKKSVEYVKPETMAQDIAIATDDSKKVSTSESTVVAKSCADTLALELKNDNTDYEKGSVIVSFQSNILLPDAKIILGKLNISLQDEVFVVQNFATTHRVIGNVKVGDELTVVCSLRENKDVKYAGVNELFTLHP